MKFWRDLFLATNQNISNCGFSFQNLKSTLIFISKFISTCVTFKVTFNVYKS